MLVIYNKYLVFKKLMGCLEPPNSNYLQLLVLRCLVNRFQSSLDYRQFQGHTSKKTFFASFTLHSISKGGFQILFVGSIFDAKEEKANFYARK